MKNNNYKYNFRYWIPLFKPIFKTASTLILCVSTLISVISLKDKNIILTRLEELKKKIDSSNHNNNNNVSGDSWRIINKFNKSSTRTKKDSKSKNSNAAITNQQYNQSSSYKSEYKLLEGVKYWSSGQLAIAYECFSTAIRENPKDARAYNNRGYVLRDIKKFKESIYDFQKAIELDPDYPEAYYGLALSHRDIGQNKEAIQAFDYCIKHIEQFDYIDNDSLQTELNKLKKQI